MKSLAIVNSPLQVMSAVEYLKEYGIKEVDFVVPFFSVEYLKHNRGVLRYLNDEGYQYKVFITKNVCAILRYYKTLGKYHRFIIGDIRSLDKKMLMLFYAEDNIDIIYVDDGNAAMMVGKEINTEAPFRALLSRFVDYMLNKRINNRVFYSAFIKEKEIAGIPVIHNEMRHLRINGKQIEDVVIIVGCFCSAFTGLGADYLDYLQKLDHYIREKWPSVDVKYYPHRREDNTEQVYRLCRQLDWTVCLSRINIETDIAQSLYLPCEIIGFGSSALYLLKMICDNVLVTSIHFTESADYLHIEKEYESAGIKIIRLN